MWLHMWFFGYQALFLPSETTQSQNVAASLDRTKLCVVCLYVTHSSYCENLQVLAGLGCCRDSRSAAHVHCDWKREPEVKHGNHW